MTLDGEAGGLSVVRFGDLDENDLTQWQHLIAGNPDLDSPFFAPGYFAALERAGAAVLTVVARDEAGRAEAFLSLDRRGRALFAAGSPGADFQGPVCAPGYRVDVPAVLRTVGATRLYFDHLRANASGFERWRPVAAASPYLVVEGGVDAYLERSGPSARANLGQARRKLNRLVREHGPVDVDVDSPDPERLDQVIALKRRQYRRTHARDHFAPAARRDLLHDLLATRTGDVRGVLTVVSCGPRVVAGHFGLRRRGVLHWWFPVYDPEFAWYAPGWLLLRSLVASAPELGLTRLDLGRGDAEYKRRAMTGQQVVHAVRVELNPLSRAARTAARAAATTVRSSPAAPLLKRLVRRGDRQARRL